MMKPRAIELLSPARNIDCGLAAVDHGADAVYIGAARFGARAAAGNPIEDIARLADYAHTYHARIYATVNTVLRDDELAETEQLIRQLWQAGVDALIVQDLAYRFRAYRKRTGIEIRRRSPREGCCFVRSRHARA